MNNFIFENATKVYFGKDCVKEYLSCFAKSFTCLWRWFDQEKWYL